MGEEEPAGRGREEGEEGEAPCGEEVERDAGCPHVHLDAARWPEIARDCPRSHMWRTSC